MANYRISYAQNREDIILSGFLKDVKRGFYVDVGANHPDHLSITKIFYDRGWSGINIEPNPNLFRRIQFQRKRDINLNVGAADKNGELTLREYPKGDGLSTFSGLSQAKYQKRSFEYSHATRDHKDYKVKVRRLADIFAEYNVETIHFMSIDVEGFEYEVLSGNDWKRYRPQVICIEADKIIQHDWRPILKAAHYTWAFNDGLNDYYVANEHDKLRTSFSYVNAVLSGDPVLRAPIIHEIRRLEDRIAKQEMTAYNLRQEIDRLNAYIAVHSRFRSLVKQLGVSVHKMILLRIEKLNHPKPRQLPPLQISADVSPEQRLAMIESYDIEAYYGVKMRKPQLYRLIHGAYMWTVLMIYKVMRVVFGVIRRVMHA